MEQESRIKRVINWLVFQGYIESQNDLATRLGYSKSYMSQALHGHENLSKKFADKLCSFDSNLNSVWLLSGNGDMFLNNPFSELKTLDDEVESASSSDIVINAAVWEEIKRRDRQVDELISMLRSSLDEAKKMAVQQDAPAGCADAV